MKKGIVLMLFFLYIPIIAFSQQVAGGPLAELQRQVQVLQQQIVQLQQSLASGFTAAQEQINSLNSQVAILQSQLSTAQAQLNDHATRLSSLETELAAAQQDVASLQNDLVTEDEIIDLIKTNALSKQPDYDSGWFDLAPGSSVILTHGLGLYSWNEKVLVYLQARDAAGYDHSVSGWMMTEWWDDKWEFWSYGASWGHLTNEYITVRNHSDNCKYEGRRPFSCIVSSENDQPMYVSFRVFIWKVTVSIS